MVIIYIAHFLLTYSNALYKQGIYGWDRTSAYIGAAGSRYQYISDLTQHMNEWNEASPQHRELHALPSPKRSSTQTNWAHSKALKRHVGEWNKVCFVREHPWISTKVIYLKVSLSILPISTKSDKSQKPTKCTVRDPEYRKGRKYTLCSVSANSQADRKNNFTIKRAGSH